MLQLDRSVDTAVVIDSFLQKKRGKLTLDDLIEELKGVLTNSWKKSTKEALIKALSDLSEIEGPVTSDELDLIEQNVGEILGQPISEAKKKQVLDIEKALFTLGISEGAKNTGVNIAWNLADKKSLSVLDRNLMFWIGSHYDDNLSEGFKATLQDFFEGGYNRKDLSELMKVHFKALGEKPDSYWNLLADHTATKTREIGRVSGYEKAGVEVVRVKARLDDKTTAVCRRLHGQVIAVKDLRKQVSNYLNACETMDKEKIKSSWPWISDKDAERKLSSKRGIDKQIRAGNIGLPPYHARCRTITVSEFIAEAGDKILSDDEIELGAVGESHTAPRRRKEWQLSPGTQSGSNDGGLVVSPTGGKYYAKFYKNPDQARHEVLANDIFSKLGVGAPKSHTESINVYGEKRFAHLSKWIEDTEQMGSPSNRTFTKYEEKQLTKQWLGAILNGNRDMVGASYDNMVKKGRKWYVIDQGGSYHFRAQGGIKDYTAEVLEWDSTLSPGRNVGNLMNPIISKTIKEDPEEYIKWIRKLSTSKINNSVLNAGLKDTGIATTIAARRDFIIKKLEELRKPKVVDVGKRPVRSHLGEKLSVKETVDLIVRDCKEAGITIDNNVAREVARNMRGYTGSWYKPMRHAQIGRIDNADMLSRASLVEEYLDVAAAYPVTKKLYRGMQYKREVFEKIGIGGEFELEAMASFSTTESTAKSFAGANSTGAMLVLQGGTKYGTTIQHLSKYFNENEVLVSGRNVIKLIGLEEKNGMLYVYGEASKYAAIERQIIKVIIMKLSDEDILSAGDTDMSYDEMVKWKADADADLPVHSINEDGEHVYLYADGSEKQVPKSKIKTYVEVSK